MMKIAGKWKTAAIMMAGVALTLNSCATVHRHHRHHHPRRHRIVVVAEQATAVGQDNDYTMTKGCLAMAEPDAYGHAE